LPRTDPLNRRTRQLLEGPVVRTLLIMAAPNALVMFAQLSIGLVEVYFVSRLGVDALAGVSLVFPVLSWIGAVSQGAVGGGVVTAVARALGRGDREGADRLVWCAMAEAVNKIDSERQSGGMIGVVGVFRPNAISLKRK
jgi:Na+-driven multidrug efflux pump